MTTKVAVLGASGNVGSAIVKELASRGKFEVFAVARNSSKVDASLSGVKAVAGDASKPEELVPKIKGIDVLISALLHDVPSATIVNIARESGAKRVIVVGGAGSLVVAEGGPRLIDTPAFPDEFKPYAIPGLKFYEEIIKVNDYNWTFFSPPAEIGPGPKTGKYRLGTDVLITDKDGNSKISYDDYAIALVDEVENGKFIKKRFTAAY